MEEIDKTFEDFKDIFVSQKLANDFKQLIKKDIDIIILKHELDKIKAINVRSR